MSRLDLGGRELARGAHHFVRWPVTRDLTGPVDVVAHVVAGREPGLTLTLLSMLHGSEWLPAAPDPHHALI